MTKKDKLAIRVKTIRADNFDPGINIHTVEATTNEATWRETFGSVNEVRAFIRGVKCAESFRGNFDIDISGDV